MSEELAIRDMNTDLMGNGSGGVVCSIKGQTRQDKIKIFNASNNPTHPLGDYINKTISVTDVIAEWTEVADDETGEVSTTPRIVLIDADGESYVALSKGVFNALRKAIMAFGEPTWDPPLQIEVKQIPVGRGKMTSFDVVG